MTFDNFSLEFILSSSSSKVYSVLMRFVTESSYIKIPNSSITNIFPSDNLNAVGKLKDINELLHFPIKKKITNTIILIYLDKKIIY